MTFVKLKIKNMNLPSYILRYPYLRIFLKSQERYKFSALATLLYVDWLPQVNGPPGVLLSEYENHKYIIIYVITVKS